MYLIETSKHEHGDFPPDKVPCYAILSHRWSEQSQELTFQDYQENRKKNTSGHRKVREFCERAMKDGFSWAWVDTCCIDKRSSAELSESINSMWSYYEKAAVCYVYMSDVHNIHDWHTSEWWQRGWTLQELLAPSKVLFYARNWQSLGNKSGLAERISQITRIPASVLRKEKSKQIWSVAQKMSWAAGRLTTRIKDRAYSLMGIFRVNMPLLYGEGAKAFQRLQLEILQKFPDESVFAWHPICKGPHHVLAISPDAYKACLQMGIPIRAYRYQMDVNPRRESPPRVTSWGIEIRANARRLVPRRQLSINEKRRAFLWALTLTMSHGDQIKELQCTLVLVQSGPAPYSYQRYAAIYNSPSKALRQLRANYHIGGVEHDRLFFLNFDRDLVY